MRVDPTDFASTTLRELRDAPTEDIRDYCKWNDPNGDFDEDDYGDPITRQALLDVVVDWDASERCGYCHEPMGMGASDADWAEHGSSRCTGAGGAS